MAAPPDDLTSWRPDDGSEEEAEEMATNAEQFLEWIKTLPFVETEDSFIEATDAAVAEGLSLNEWYDLPRPRRDMLLQRRRVPRKAR